MTIKTTLELPNDLTMLDAVSAGARPLVPDDLCYPEQYPAPYWYPPGEGVALVERLHEWLEGALPPPPDVSAWSVQAVRPLWAAKVNDLINVA